MQFVGLLLVLDCRVFEGRLWRLVIGVDSGVTVRCQRVVIVRYQRVVTVRCQRVVIVRYQRGCNSTMSARL
jgi:hypothetical protein